MGKRVVYSQKMKKFCSIDLKVYKHLQTYLTHLRTKFERILSCLSGILGAFSGILHNLEMFWPQNTAFMKNPEQL